MRHNQRIPKHQLTGEIDAKIDDKITVVTCSVSLCE